MDIQEFIREALAQVISGIAAAKEATKNNGHAEINPLLLRIKTPVEGSVIIYLTQLNCLGGARVAW